MSKLFKKSLAFCVAIAMVFTLFAGTISVNAEDAEETLTVTLEVENKRVAEGATEVVLPLDVTCSGDTSINAIRLILTTEAGTVTNVASAEPTEDYTLYYNGQYALLNVPNNEDNTLGGINAANLLVTVALNEGLDKEAYGITIDCRSENAADANENALKISYETGYILMPHTHTIAEEYTYDTENHWKVCTSEFCDVADYKDGLEAHVWENDGEAVTDCEATGTQAQKCLCGATRTIDVDAIGHDYEYTNDGETHSAVCKNNAEHVITGEAHDYVDGKCVCGAEEVTECEHEWANTGDPVYTDCTSAGIQLQTCSLCGETQNVEVAAKGHNYGAPVDNGDGTHTATCANDAEHKETANHEFVEGKCECGAKQGPIMDPTLAGAITEQRLNVSDSVGIYFKVKALRNTYGYDDIEFRVTRKEITNRTDGTYVYTGKTITTVLTSADSTTQQFVPAGLFYFVYNDPALYEMQSEVSYSLYLYKDGEAFAYYDLGKTTIQAMAQDQYDDDESKREILVAILNLGTKAQEHFASMGTASENVLKQMLDENGLPNANVSQDYALGYDGLEAIDTTGNPSEFRDMQMRILKAPAFFYTLRLADYKDPSKLNFKIEYTTLAEGPRQVVKEFNGAELSADELKYAQTAGLYYFTFDKSALYDIDKVITTTVTNADTGEVIVTHQHSIESKLVTSVNESGTAGQVYQATAALLKAARNFWPDYFAE